MTTIEALLPMTAVVIACVAGIRRTWPAIDGWRAVVAVVVTSLALCVARAADVDPALWRQGLVEGVLVAVLALGGDSYLTRLAGKAGTTKRVEVVDTTAMVSRTGDSVSTGTPIIPPAPPTPTITEKP